MLAQLLKALACQQSSDAFTYSIVVIDNDATGSASEVVKAFQDETSIRVHYSIEAVRGIPVARNRAISEAGGNLVAFIDDDELPNRDWLDRLFATMREYRVAGVLGPVKPHFLTTPPEWVLKSRLFERSTFRTGTVLTWRDTRTGNVLLRRDLFADTDNLFNADIGHGEDKDFFRRMIEKGHSFVWCDEATVYEIEPPERCRRSYFLRRALVRGSYYVARATNRPLQITKSAFTLGVYCAALPMLSLFGQPLLMKSLIKICESLGCLIGACGLRLEHEFSRRRAQSPGGGSN